jgi:type VI secretion system secreted protein VgrG
MHLKRLVGFLSAIVLGLAAAAAPVGTAFTYQGRLTSNGTPASGRYDLQFTLYDAVTNGTVVAGPLTNTVVNVSDGLFHVSLDFGSVLDGNARWLEIAARTNGAAVFTNLSARQPLTAAPYASYAPSAGTAALASGVSTGAITSAMLAEGAVTTAKIGAGAVKPANIDDGGSGAYDDLMEMARGLRTTEPLPFNDLSLVVSNSGAAPTLTFRLDGASFGKVLGFVGREGLSEVYEYVVEVLMPRPSLDPESQVGREGGLYFARNGRTTTFAGLITGCSQASYGGDSTLYTFHIEPALALLGLSSDYRIYQDGTVPEVVSQLYFEVTSNTLSETLSGSYPQRPLTIQFAETDLNFFSRLLEYDGAFYFFRQEEGASTLILGDAFSSYLPAPLGGLRYYGNFATNPHPAEECLRAFQKATRESTSAATLNGYDFTAPKKDLLAKSSDPTGRGETYEFDARVTEPSEMDRLARLRLEWQRVERNMASGAGNAPDLRPGYTLTLEDGSGSDLGGNYVVTAVRHAAFRRTTNGVSSLYYGNQFEVLPAATPYRPARKTPRPVVPACTAVVTGPAGQELWTDKYGRVKVRFHWDRYGKQDENSSAWIRVASPWAGKHWGTSFVPRIGQEVLVEFVNGDPDQPVITGSFYNGDRMPPYDLPGNATQSGIKTRSSPGGATDNSNEIRFEDKKGSEQLYIKAEKDLDLAVNYDMTLGVDHDLPFTVGNDLTLRVGHDLPISAGHNLTLATTNDLVIWSGRGVGINTANDPALALKVGGTTAATLFQGSGAGLNDLPAAALTGGINDARLSPNVSLLAGPQTFSGAKTFTNTANSFTGNGSSLTAVNADRLDGQHGAFYQNAGNLSTGTVTDARLSTNVPRLDATQSFSGGNSFLGPVGVGGVAGSDALTINGNARLNNNDLFLRDGADLNHGLGWYGASKLFDSANVDGPVLYGCDGGGLGTACSSQKLALRWRSDGNVAIDPNSQNSGALLPGLTFGSSSGEGISSKRTAGGNGFGLDFYTSNQVRVAISPSGNVGIGKANPVTLLDVAGPIRATGAIRSGIESGTAQPAGYPAGSDGLVIRRARSTTMTAGHIVARTDKLTLERDGTIAGLRLSYPASPGRQIVTCLGISTNGNQVIYRNVLNNPATGGSLAVFSDPQKIVHYDISFGDTYSSSPAHTARVVLDRYDDGSISDYYLVGTVTSTYNQ